MGCIHAACIAGAKRPIPEVKSGSSISGGDSPGKGYSCELFVGCSVSFKNITESASGAVEGEGDKMVGDSGLCVNDGVDNVTDAHVGLESS